MPGELLSGAAASRGTSVTREKAGPGQESVWDYPRPPRLERTEKYLRISLGKFVIAETTRGFRLLETSHPPTYYFPPDSIAEGALVEASGSSLCEYKGLACYWSIRAEDRLFERAAWSYENPTPAFAAIEGYVAFYAGRGYECRVDGELVTPQPGGFYGGWITRDIAGPFKGVPGSWGW